MNCNRGSIELYTNVYSSMDETLEEYIYLFIYSSKDETKL